MPLTKLNAFVSVVISMYNAEKYIGECLESPLAQTFFAKAITDGKLNLKFLGLYVHALSDQPKRIPYWIDYTVLTINSKLIFDKLTPVWQDKPFLYEMDVKAGEEVVIQTEWLPHRSDN